MKPFAPERWAVLSPRLDALLALDTAARQRTLEAWRAAEPGLVADLELLLKDADSPAASQFLEGQALPPVHAAGQRCGAWTLVEPIGAGGMGSVWLAERSDGRYEGRAAVKLPHPAWLARGGTERFEREGRLLARLAHPHIAALLDAGVSPGGQPYLVLEFVQGEPITRWCEARGSSTEARVALLLDVIDAVAHAHQQLVLHRDLKPANILVDAQGRVKLLDFGIAKLMEPEPATAGDTTATQAVFTPDHAAPEQLQGGPVSTATDVYALGVLMYQLLAGAHPTAEAGHTPVDRLRAVVEREPQPMSAAAPRLARQLRGDLDTIAAKALKKNPAERYASAAALADDLRRWRDGLPVLARPDSAGYRLSRFVRRHRAGVAVAAGALLLLVGGTAATAWQARQARIERDEARWQAERAFARSNLFNLMLGRMGSLDAPLTQRGVLESALQLIEERHAGEPKMAVELLLPIAGQFHSLGDIAADLRVMQRAARLAEASGSAELVAQVACSTVDTHIALGNAAAAVALVEQAEAAIATMASPPLSLRVACWAGRAMASREMGQTAVALEAAQRAQQALEAEAGGGTPRGNMYPFMLGLVASLRGDIGDVPGAFALSERLLALSREAGGAASLDTRVRQRNLGLLMLEAGEVLQARPLLQGALAGWPDGTVPPHMLLALATAHVMLGDAGAARAVAEQAAAAAARLQDKEFATEASFVLARAARMAGDLGEARRWLQSVETQPRVVHRNPLLHTPGSEWALLLLAEGKAPEALRQIQAELQRLQESGSRRLGPQADAWRCAARIALAAGEPALARGFATAALEAGSRGARDAQASAHVGEALLLLAQALQALGEPTAAAEAQRAVPALAAGLGVQHPLHAEALRLAQR